MPLLGNQRHAASVRACSGKGRAGAAGLLLVGLMAGTSAVAPGAGALAGALDPSFGSGGRVVTPIAIGEVRGGGMAIQPDGRIVVAGTIPGAGGTDFVVARYLPDGGLDPSFGSGGGVVTPVGPGVDEANAIALQPDGRIVVAGRAVISANESDFAVVRYLPDGLLDPAFGSGGKVVTDVSPSADEGTAGDGGRAVVVQPDGRIVVGGTSFEDFGLVRYLANGSLDTTFGTGGRVVTDLSPADRLSALALRPDGRIVAGGSALGTGSQADFVLVGYTASGALDPGFGGAGAVATDFSGDEDSV
ncbi:MAG: delta-60 repeat domain-containing protein, partial [Acidimicrobiales bacterium]